MHASWQPTGAVPSRFRPHFGGLPTSKSMLPCRRELDFQKNIFFGAEFEKGLQKRPRNTSKRSRGVPRSARRRPQNFPVEGPGAPRGSKGGRLASRTSPQGLRQAWRLHFGSEMRRQPETERGREGAGDRDRTRLAPSPRTCPAQAWRLQFGSVWEPFSEDCWSQRTLVQRMSGIFQRLRRGHSG